MRGVTSKYTSKARFLAAKSRIKGWEVNALVLFCRLETAAAKHLQVIFPKVLLKVQDKGWANLGGCVQHRNHRLFSLLELAAAFPVLSLTSKRFLGHAESKTSIITGSDVLKSTPNAFLWFCMEARRDSFFFPKTCGCLEVRHSCLRSCTFWFYAMLFVSHRLLSLFNEKTIKWLAFVSFQTQNIVLAKKCLLER